MESYHGVSIVYEDNHLLVVVKPPNMPTQADDSGDADLHSTMKAYIAERYSKPGAVYLGLVHRLDRPVGGLVVLAKTSKAADRLSAQVRDKTMHRQYVAAVRGRAKEADEICDFLLKDGKTNMVRVVPANTPGAKDAKLRYQKCGEADGLTLVRVRLFTGRSHQIRVQLSLWGAHLGLIHPTKKEEMHFDALPPMDAQPWKQFDAAVWTKESKICL